MSVRRCALCNSYIEWMMTRFGRRLPFNYHPIPIEEDVNGEGWVPGKWIVRRRERVAMAPISHYGQAKREAVRHVVLVHSCPEYKALIEEVTEPQESLHGDQVH